MDRGVWTAKTVKRPRQQPAHPQYANYWAPLTRKRHTMPHSAQSQRTNYWAPRTRKQHQQEHWPQRSTESSDPTQHAKGRTGDRPGPRKGATTRRNVTQGGGGCCYATRGMGTKLYWLSLVEVTYVFCCKATRGMGTKLDSFSMVDVTYVFCWVPNCTSSPWWTYCMYFAAQPPEAWVPHCQFGGQNVNFPATCFPRAFYRAHVQPLQAVAAPLALVVDAGAAAASIAIPNEGAGAGADGRHLQVPECSTELKTLLHTLGMSSTVQLLRVQVYEVWQS